ncbi:hypothetical protein BJX70DRAFT_399145 [Aspergillus crustosus]
MSSMPLHPISRSPKQQTESYDTLAALMTNDKGLSIFRSFKRLNAKNLLYLQAEIAIKEKELNMLIQRDHDLEAQRTNSNVSHSNTAGNRGSSPVFGGKMSCSVRMLKEGIEPSEQWVKWLEVRELLEKYNTALTQHAQLLRLKPPYARDLDIFRDWIKSKAFCSMAVERNQWFGAKGENTEDLIALRGRYDNVDSLTRWAFRVAIPVWHRYMGNGKGGDLETGTVYYDDEKIIRATRVTSTITSSVIPASSMLVLYLVNDMIWRLVIIILYNIGFSIIIGLLAKARRVEVFAASTAFAAVQVAFITNFPRD